MACAVKQFRFSSLVSQEQGCGMFHESNISPRPVIMDGFPVVVAVNIQSTIYPSYAYNWVNGELL